MLLRALGHGQGFVTRHHAVLERLCCTMLPIHPMAKCTWLRSTQGALRMPGAEGSLSPQPGVQLHFVEMGHGPAICLCHGFPESWLSWRYQVRRWGNGMVMLAW